VLVSLGLGLLLGVLGLGIMFGVEQGLGWTHWQLNATPATESTLPESAGPALVPTLLLTLLLGIWVSLTEELVFRGFLQNQLQQNYDPWAAAAITSLIFALLHLVWEGRENIPQLPGLWLMGMVLTLARWADGGNLGLAWGLHAGWIWAIASLDATQALSYTGRGAVWLTGLGGRPLAGLLGILSLLATAALLWLGQTIKPSA
jgi:membrane protease YdiL (CAAX protease family)